MAKCKALTGSAVKGLIGFYNRVKHIYVTFTIGRHFRYDATPIYNTRTKHIGRYRMMLYTPGCGLWFTTQHLPHCSSSATSARIATLLDQNLVVGLVARFAAKLQDKTNKTNVYWNYGTQEAGLVKHKLHPMNSVIIWYNKNTRYKIHIIQYTVHNINRRIKHTDSFTVLEVGQGVVKGGLISFGSWVGHWIFQRFT